MGLLKMLKIVYIHVGNEKQEYLNMLRISIASVRKNMPNIEINILTDKNTAEYLVSCGFFTDVLLKIIPVDVPEDLNVVEKSRYLKTNLRNNIRGDFLYIDSDTLVCCNLTDTLIEQSVSMVLDENRLLNEQDDKGEKIIHQAKMRGYDFLGYNHYYNSGVMLVKDDKSAQLFFQKWYEEWNKTRKPKMHQDQFSLNWVNKNINVINELDGSWNCQATASYKGLECLRNVKIIHYLSLQDAGLYQLNDRDFLKQDIDNESIQKIIDYPEKGFREFHMFAYDSVEYKLLQTSHFHFIKRIYDKHKTMFKFCEKILKMFRKKK